MPVQSYPGKGHSYDLIIVGAGITGTECALACAGAGLDVLLITTSLDTIYNLLGDGVVLEPPSGTFMAKAHQSISLDNGFVGNWDMHRAAKFEIEHTKGIHFLQSNVSSLIVEENEVKGIDTWEGVARYSKKTALCVGSFLEARLSIGQLTETAGRLSEMAYDDLYLQLEQLGFNFELLRLNAEFEDESLPYTVACKVFSRNELDKKTFRLKRVNSLYAAGLCSSGFISYETAAQQGVELAKSVIETVN